MLVPFAGMATRRVRAPLALGILATIVLAAVNEWLPVPVTFLTPIGHHCNLLIPGPGQYRFGDFVRVGAPLTVLLALVSAWMARWLWLDGPMFPAW